MRTFRLDMSQRLAIEEVPLLPDFYVERYFAPVTRMFYWAKYPAMSASVIGPTEH